MEPEFLNTEVLPRAAGKWRCPISGETVGEHAKARKGSTAVHLPIVPEHPDTKANAGEGFTQPDEFVDGAVRLAARRYPPEGVGAERTERRVGHEHVCRSTLTAPTAGQTDTAGVSGSSKMEATLLGRRV